LREFLDRLTLPAILLVHSAIGKIVFLWATNFMSKDEIKYEINRVLDNFSDQALSELLSFLKQLESQNDNSLLRSRDLQKILSEDKQLLEKLAQ
jgi:hypothetical protein